MPRMLGHCIADLNPSHSFYAESGNGSIRIGNYYSARPSSQQLSPSCRMALAMTEACHRRGTGRVYCVASDPEPLPLDNKSPHAFEAYMLEKSAPNLIYLPEHWTAKERAEWTAMAPSLRLHRCWAPHGWVHEEFPVLPFAANLNLYSDWTEFWFHDIEVPRIMVFITPKPYVTLTTDLAKLCVLDVGSDHQGRMFRRVRRATKTGWALFQRYKRASFGDLLDSLDVMYRHKTEHLMQYKLVAKQVRETRLRAAV